MSGFGRNAIPIQAQNRHNGSARNFLRYSPAHCRNRDHQNQFFPNRNQSHSRQNKAVLR